MRDPALWSRINSYELDDPEADIPFTQKLRKAEGWGVTQASLAIAEYKRFLYLSVVSDERVTPSAPVDAVWHMHLLYTHDYWERLCPQVLGRALHHVPATGPKENPRHKEQYAHTWALYQTEFGEDPPAALWPAPTAGGRAGRSLVGMLRFGIAFAGILWLVSTFFSSWPWQFAALAAVFGATFVTAIWSGTGSTFSLSYETGSGGDSDGGGCGD